jgi:hypothetical protein
VEILASVTSVGVISFLIAGVILSVWASAGSTAVLGFFIVPIFGTPIAWITLEIARGVIQKRTPP